MQRKCACGGTPGLTGECESCRKKKLQRRSENLEPSATIYPPSSLSEVPPIVHEILCSPGHPLDAETRAFMEPRFGHDFSKLNLLPHTKLQLSHPTDTYEQEADHVAEQVIRALTPRVSAESRSLRETSSTPIQQRGQSQGGRLSRKPEPTEREREPAAEKGASGSINEAATTVESQLEDIKGRGAMLPDSIRVLFQSRFGYDFSRVRVHTDARATNLARAVSAHAFTVGSDLVFAEGQYDLDTISGRKLLAHELTHVVQQGFAPPLPLLDPTKARDGNGSAEQAAKQSENGANTSTTPKVTAARNSAVMLSRPRISNLRSGVGLFRLMDPACRETGRLPGGLAFEGTLAHIAIETDYKLGINPAGLVEFSIPYSGKLGGDGRADIVDMSNHEIYEIKTWLEKDRGLIEAQQYRDMAQLFCDPDVKWGLGQSYPGGLKSEHVIPMPPDREVLAYQQPSHPGVIIYRTRRRTKQKEPVRDPAFDPLPDVIILAAAAEAARKLSKNVVKGAATKVNPVLRYVSCLAGLYLLASGRARAGGVEGEDPLILMLKSGVPPKADSSAVNQEQTSELDVEGAQADTKAVEIPPEILEMLDRDRELKRLVEEGLKSGNPSAAQMELNQRMLKIIAENKDQFSNEDLKVLLVATDAVSSEVPEAEVTAESLRQMIEQAKQRKESPETKPDSSGKGQLGAGGGQPGSSKKKGLAKGDPTALGGLKTARHEGPKPSEATALGRLKTAGREGPKPGEATTKSTLAGGSLKTSDQPPINAEAETRLESSPTTVRSLFELLTKPDDKLGPEVTTEALNRFLDIVPQDLTEDELAKLTAAATPITSHTITQALDKLEKSIHLIRAMPDSPLISSKEKAYTAVKLQGKEPTVADTTATMDPAGSKSTLTGKKVPHKEKTPTGGSSQKVKASKADDDALERIKKRVYAFDWSQLPKGKWQLQNYKGLKDPVSAALYGRFSNGEKFGAEVFFQHVKDANGVSAKIISSSDIFIVDESAEGVPAKAGRVISGTYLSGYVLHNLVDVTE
jgi:uncharacterized protein DUF4157